MTIALDGPRTKGRSPIDIHVGSRIRALRLHRRLTVTKAAEKAGIKREQWYEIEAHRTRVTVGKLAIIARVLRRSPQWFFRD